jgi:DNA-binding transcriptional LysR family regulator
MLSWDDFRFVKAIADARSLAGAATVLGVNHSTVFRRLGQIEDGLGTRLFERGRAGYALTAGGEEMVQLAERMSEDIVGFERKVTGQDLRPSGELRVTMNDVILLHLFTPILAGFRRTYPQIKLDLVISNQRLNLSKRDADVAVRTVFQRPEGLAGHCIARIAWAVLAPSNVAARTFDAAVHGREHDWIGFDSHLPVGAVAKWFKENVAEDRIVCRFNTVLGVAEAVAAGIGFALLPCLIGDSAPGVRQLGPPVRGLETELWVLTHPDLLQTARVRAFIEHCEAEMARRKSAIERPD